MLHPWGGRWQDEAACHSDDDTSLVVLRGPDTYRNLPNKTLRLLRYMLAHPAGGSKSGRADRMQRGVGNVRRWLSF